MKPHKRYSVLYLTKVPTDLKAHFKAWCAKRGRTMQETINQLLKATISGKIKKHELL